MWGRLGNGEAMRYILTIALMVAGTALVARQPTGLRAADETPVAQPSDDRAPADAANATAKDSGPGGTADAKTEEQPIEARGTADGKAGEGTADAAQEAAAEPETPSWQAILDDVLHSGAMGLMIDGGIFMWPILLMGIVATGVIIERYRSLKLLTTDTAALRAEVADLLRGDRAEEALQQCHAHQGPVPAVLSAGLRKFVVLRRLDYDPARIEEQVVKAMDDYGVHIVAALERHLPVLATVSSAAPMIGFLGTVQGMVIAFGDIVAQMGETNVVEAAASGIKVALLTTVLGLIVGIPAYVAYNYFTSVINRYVLDVEESASELIETVTLHMAIEERETGVPTT
jgi:biopolymer transport protein ExbB